MSGETIYRVNVFIHNMYTYYIHLSFHDKNNRQCVCSPIKTLLLVSSFGNDFI